MGRFLLILLLAGAVAYLVPAPPEHHEASVEIDAAREKVWENLSTLERMPHWHAGVSSVSFEGKQKQGVGAVAQLDTKPVSYTLRVVQWEPYNRMDFAVETDPDLSEDHVLRFTVHPRYGRTLVRVVEEYRMRGGYLGFVLDKFFFSRVGEAGRGEGLAHLKRLSETGMGLQIP